MIMEKSMERLGYIEGNGNQMEMTIMGYMR